MKTSPKYLLYPFSWLYGIVVGIRNVLFNINVLHSERFPTWVISIGNLSVGGTGKSPHAEYFVRLLNNMSLKEKRLGMGFGNLAILSRGYGRITKGFLSVTETSSACEVGDEPLQLKRRLKEVFVAVDENRVEGINIILKQKPSIRAIVLDDAFQHRYVKSDLPVLLTSYYAPFYNDHLLPVGRLRESRRGYKRARVIIVTNTPENLGEADKREIIKKIKPTYKQKVFFSHIAYQPLVPVFNKELPGPALDKSYSVILFTGIANANRLRNYLAGIVKDINHISFPDHYVFQVPDITKVITAYSSLTNSNKIIITTEKDAMRLSSEELQKAFGAIPVYYMPIQVKMQKEEQLEDVLISKLTAVNFARLIQ